MSDVRRCENCLYVTPLEVNQKDQIDFGNWACRRYPPIPVRLDDRKFHSMLVPVNHNWWCGEWKPTTIKRLASAA